MKANELMVGDLIYLIDETSKVREFEITQVSTERVTGIIVDANNSYIRTSAADTYYNEEHYRPIPLTPKILEKNGWIKDGYFYRAKDGSYIQLGQLFEHATFSCKKDGINREVVTSPSILKYVHQLQHALRLCGIEKTIEL